MFDAEKELQVRQENEDRSVVIKEILSKKPLKVDKINQGVYNIEYEAEDMDFNLRLKPFEYARIAKEIKKNSDSTPHESASEPTEIEGSSLTDDEIKSYREKIRNKSSKVGWQEVKPKYSHIVLRWFNTSSVPDMGKAREEEWEKARSEDLLNPEVIVDDKIGDSSKVSGSSITFSNMLLMKLHKTKYGIIRTEEIKSANEQLTQDQANMERKISPNI